MAQGSIFSDPRALAALATAHFGQPVRRITRPGSDKRPIRRIYLRDRNVIASLRPDPERAEKERIVQSLLAPHTAHVPIYLGMRGGVSFQSDAGTKRLSVAINALPPSDRPALAQEAIAAIFDIQRAADKAGLARRLAPVGLDRDWLERFTGGPARLARMIGLNPGAAMPAGLAAAITPARLRFVKWDCRSGNAALDRCDYLRWFDFEHSGLRHGAEDLAWLATDEHWPLPIRAMRGLIARALPADADEPPGQYLRFFDLFATLQACKRLRLILREAGRNGWVARDRALKFDLVGADPRLGRRLARQAVWLAGQQTLTRPLAAVFEATAQVFEGVLSGDGHATRRASDHRAAPER